MLHQLDSQSDQSTDGASEPIQFYRLRRPAVPVDKRENPSTKDVPNLEDMPNENLVSNDASLQAHQETLSELLTQVRARLTQLETLLAQNPELATVRIVDFNPATTVLKSVRETVWSIFNATAKFIGRNSAEAVIAETANLFSTRHDIFNLAATETTQGKKDSDIGAWIRTDVMPKLDADMNKYAGISKNGTILVGSLYQKFSKPIYLRVNRL